ncbi:MAG: hypothetical protein AB8F26_12040, partial [Phycisphaerales bacterium]
MRRPIQTLLSMTVLFPIASATMPAFDTRADAATLQPAEEQEQQLAWLKDFIHFVKIARFDIAADVGQQLIDSGIDPQVFVDMVDGSREQSRFEEAVAAAMRVPAIEPVAAALDTLYRDGKLSRVRNAEEIARN